jgi:hypothetical protein
MNKDTSDLSAVVAAIEALTAEVRSLKEVVATLSAPPSPAAEPIAAPAVVLVAAVEAAPISILPEPVSLAQTETERVYEQIEAVLAGVFMAAQDEDDEAGFEAFLSLIHSDRTDAPRSIPSLKEFTWKSIKKKLDKYLGEGGGPTDYSINKRVPLEIKESENNAKLFLESPNRSPVPISFRRDPSESNAWRVTDSSL